MRYFLLLISILTLISCSSSKNENTEQETMNTEQETMNIEQETVSFDNYSFIKAGNQKAGVFTNTMELYYLTDELNIDNLKAFCTSKKNSFKTEGFLYVVFFDDAQKANFPTTPFTAGYALDDDLMKHIKAMYIFNPVNNYSKLEYYNLNMYESVMQSIDI
jgi:hypothetical protein